MSKDSENWQEELLKPMGVQKIMTILILIAVVALILDVLVYEEVLWGPETGTTTRRQNVLVANTHGVSNNVGVHFKMGEECWLSADAPVEMRRVEGQWLVTYTAPDRKQTQTECPSGTLYFTIATYHVNFN